MGFGGGNGVRLELEGSYRSNQQSNAGKTSTGSSTSAATTGTSTVANGSENKYGAMANVLYDINIGQRWIFPYVGAGFGYQFVNWKKIGVSRTHLDYGNGFVTTITPPGTIGQIAYQAIVGASFPLSYVPGLSVTAEYRYMGVAGTRNYSGTGYTQYIAQQYTNNQTKVHATSDTNHTFLVGFRYAFNPDGLVEAATPNADPYAATAVAAEQVPAPVTTAARMYLIFFDFDRADLTPRARDIVAEAVRNSARIQHTRIEVSGHADRSGDPAYNLRLSQPRAEAVATEMGRWGGRAR